MQNIKMKRKQDNKIWPSHTGIWIPNFWSSSRPKFKFGGRLDQLRSQFLKNLDFIDFFSFSFFLKIMNQKCGSYVCVQLLQTLNILFENIRNETSIYYLLSNNHVNSIIVHKFDFSDEEVMAYYISFLKTLSFR